MGPTRLPPIPDDELDRIESALAHPLGPLDEATATAAYHAVPGFRKTILQLVGEVRRTRAELAVITCGRCRRQVEPQDVRCPRCCGAQP
jgi:hypothetical protein